MIIDPTVHRDGDDLVVRWSGEDPVAITVGPWSDEVVGTTVLATDRGEARIPGIERQTRHYVRLQSATDAVVVAERRLSMDGTVNFRDLGGYLGVDGRRVRWGRVFRSDNLANLSDGDVQLLHDLGIRLVCDLRRDEERATAPSRLAPQSEVRSGELPIGGLAAETASMAARVMRGDIREVSVEAMAQVYATILELHPDSFGTVVARAADASNLPMIVHCTAGKDRTGVASALLLSVLGVDEAVILDDYELTNGFHSEPQNLRLRPELEAAGIDFSKVQAFFSAPRAVMELTLAGLRDRYGSVEGYLAGHVGLSSTVLEDVRSALLTN